MCYIIELSELYLVINNCPLNILLPGKEKSCSYDFLLKVQCIYTDTISLVKIR